MDVKRAGISGAVLVEATVARDGRARNARAWYSLPATVFDEAARRVALNSLYRMPNENGAAVACTIRFKVVFTVRVEGEGALNGPSAEQKEALAGVRAKAEAGDPGSQLMYGLLLEMRADMNVNKERTLEWFLKAAQGGLPRAQYMVGMHALSAVGTGTKKNDNKGLIWLRMAAEAGHADAQTALANYLLRGEADVEDWARARNLLEKAAESGSRDGKYYLAALLATGPDAARRDSKRALELVEPLEADFDFDPTWFEIRAAAHAQLGDFAAAQADQKAALKRARRLGWDLTDQQTRLASYEALKPWTGNLFAY